MRFRWALAQRVPTGGLYLSGHHFFMGQTPCARRGAGPRALGRRRVAWGAAPPVPEWRCGVGGFPTSTQGAVRGPRGPYSGGSSFPSARVGRWCPARLWPVPGCARATGSAWLQSGVSEASCQSQSVPIHACRSGVSAAVALDVGRRDVAGPGNWYESSAGGPRPDPPPPDILAGTGIGTRGSRGEPPGGPAVERAPVRSDRNRGAGPCRSRLAVMRTRFSRAAAASEG